MAFATVNKKTESIGEETFALDPKMCVVNRIGEEFSTDPSRALAVQWLKKTLGLGFCIWKNDGQRGNASRRFPHIADFWIPRLFPSTHLAILHSTEPHLWGWQTHCRLFSVDRSYHLAGYMLSDRHFQCFTPMWSFWKACLLATVSKKGRSQGEREERTSFLEWWSWFLIIALHSMPFKRHTQLLKCSQELNKAQEHAHGEHTRRVSTPIRISHLRKLRLGSISELPKCIEFGNWQNWNLCYWVEILGFYITAASLLWNRMKATCLDVSCLCWTKFKSMNLAHSIPAGKLPFDAWSDLCCPTQGSWEDLEAYTWQLQLVS